YFIVSNTKSYYFCLLNVKFCYFQDGGSFQEQARCEIPFDAAYPDCKNQVERLKETWSNDPCFTDYDIDGSDCSIIIYLSEVEAWCPRLTWRKHMKKKEKRRRKAELKDDIESLMTLFSSKDVYKPLAARSLYMWRHWRSAYRYIKRDYQKERFTKKMFLYIGVLADSPFNVSTIPPLTDELVQWSDLITSLYMLGHQLTISNDRRELLERLLPTNRYKRRCKDSDNQFDLVYIDHVGIQHLTSLAPTTEIHNRVWTKYGCKFRVLDPFGTDAEFNFGKYDDSLLPGGRSSFGNLELNLRQFMTRFPMSSDNSFLGFAVGSHVEKRPFLKKKKRVVIYGDGSFAVKNETLWSWLNFTSKFMRVHYTELKDESCYRHVSRIKFFWNPQIKDPSELKFPNYVIQHGVLSYDQLDRLITKAKAVIGIGTRAESILPALAVGRGCVYINPKYDPPEDRTNTEYLKDKPSLRKISSQNPYLAKFVGRPHVITLDLNNLTEVRQAIRKITKTKVRTYIPYELTTEGFVQRINAYVENQDFCQTNDWPPVLELQIKVGLVGESCHDVCAKQGLVCEPEYFKVVNSTKVHGCRKIQTAESVIAPAKEANSTTCLLQNQPLLYNCMRSSPHYRRICPCRTYKTGQRSLCEDDFKFIDSKLI
ncbi:hypothetical protein QZH41_019079, partial [Actinostola sp. cb2023]